MRRDKPSVCLIIPVYNCENQITRLLAKLNSGTLKYLTEIVVIDNGSSDNTIQNARNLLEQVPIASRIIVNSQNVNLGGTLKRGLTYAINKEYTHAMILHGDDQANPGDFELILANLENSNSDLVIGARFHPQSRLVGYSVVRKIGNRTLNKLFYLVTGQKVNDLIAGLNIYRLGYFSDLHFRAFPNNLTFDVHILLRALHKKAKVEFIPITWVEEDQKSNAKIYRQGWIILKLLMLYSRKGSKVFTAFTSQNIVSEISKEEIYFDSEITRR